MKKIKISIKPDRSLHVDIDGFTGNSCSDVINKVEEILKVAPEEVTHKAEFYAGLSDDESVVIG